MSDAQQFSASSEESGVSNFNQWYGDKFVQQQKDVIVVTVNSRGSIFGYPLSPAIPPEKQNAGLHDQRIAVEWLRDNIANFGGKLYPAVLGYCSRLTCQAMQNESCSGVTSSQLAQWEYGIMHINQIPSSPAALKQAVLNH